MVHAGDLPLGAVTADDLDLVLRTARLHAPLTTPSGVVCRNCSWPYPCPTLLACHDLLRDAGRSALNRQLHDRTVPGTWQDHAHARPPHPR